MKASLIKSIWENVNYKAALPSAVIGQKEYIKPVDSYVYEWECEIREWKSLLKSNLDPQRNQERGLQFKAVLPEQVPSVVAQLIY